MARPPGGPGVPAPAAAPGPAGATLLACKAEAVLGLQLLTRQRAVRLAAVLVVGVTATTAASAPSVDRVAGVMLWIGGSLAALAGSRLLASGPALAAARMVVAPWWLAPAARLLGALCVIVPATLGAGVAMLATAHGPAPVARLAGVTTLYAAAVAAVVMAIAPLVGATPAAWLGMLGVWLGAASPSTAASLLSEWPAASHMAGWVWQVLPLPWHARQWLATPGAEHPVVLATWVLAGIGVAGWRLAGPRRLRWRRLG